MMRRAIAMMKGAWMVPWVYESTKEYTIPEGCPWYGMQQTFGPPNVNWCEPTICAWINEPANAWSNLAYILAALFIWRHARGAPRILRMFAPAIFLMGLFSFVYHATNNYATQFLDFIGMYLFTSLAILLNLIRLEILPPMKSVYGYVGLVLLNCVFFFTFPLIGVPVQLIIAVNTVVILLTEAGVRLRGKSRVSYRNFLLAFGLILVAQVFSLLDLKRIWCNPDNVVLHGHALWHLIGGVAMPFVYLHFREAFRKEGR